MKALGVAAAIQVGKSLFVEQIADEAVLREAWYRVQRGGRAGGVDGVTVDAFRPRADQRVTQLRESLLADTYQPSPVRRVQIPKPSGGVRVLGLPTIVDRIAQTAAERRVTYVALSAEPESSKTDPEQILLSPIFDDGYRLIFEFTRAHILSLDRRGDLETRLVAVHPVLGVVGTKTIYRFNVRLSALAARCTEHLAGAVDLFPPREHSPRASRGQIPVGEANLSFDSKVPSARRPRDEIESPEG